MRWSEGGGVRVPTMHVTQEVGVVARHVKISQQGVLSKVSDLLEWEVVLDVGQLYQSMETTGERSIEGED